MSGPIERRDAEALGGLDRLDLVEARLDLVDDRLAEQGSPMSPAEARWRHERDVVAGCAAAFLAVVAGLTALGYAAIEAVTR